MDTLIIACLVLAITNIAFAVLAYLARRQAAKSERAAMDLACDIAVARKEGYENGLTTGLRRGYGEMYMAVVKAHRDGKDPVAAAARVGKMNAEYLLADQERLTV